MKKILCMIFALLIFLPAAVALDSEGEMTFAQVKERMEKSFSLNLIDIRNTDAYDAGHLKFAMNMPVDTLQADLQNILDSGFSHMDIEIIVYGEDTDECRKAAETVTGLGFSDVSYMANVSMWPYQLMTRADEMRLLGGMEAKDIYGNTATEEMLFSQKLTMVNVWATFCNPCLQEMPDLGRISREMKDQGVQIVGIISDSLDYYGNPDEKNIALAREIAENTQADYIHIVPDQVILRNLLPQISSVPTTFFLDGQGNLVGGVYLGSRNYAAWMDIINKTLANLPAEEAAQ